jgi:hypothetical protein
MDSGLAMMPYCSHNHLASGKELLMQILPSHDMLLNINLVQGYPPVVAKGKGICYFVTLF